MRHGFFVALAGVLAGVSLVEAQPFAPQIDPAVPTGAPAVVVGAPAVPGMAAEAPGPGTYPFWVTAEALWWWIKDGPVPFPLVTSGPEASRGISGLPGVQGVLGTVDIDFEGVLGGRFSVGAWLEPSQLIGFEADFLVLEDRLHSYQASSTGEAGSAVLARPFVDAQTGESTVDLVSFPGAFAGSAVMTAKSEMWGAEANFVSLLRPAPGGGLSVAALAGFRFLELEELLAISHTKGLLPGSVITNPDNTQTIIPGGITGFGGAILSSPTMVGVHDTFTTKNRFYGGQVGGRVRWQGDLIFVQAQVKIALGATCQELSQFGLTELPGGAQLPMPSGLLVNLGNVGKVHHSEFSIIPELGVNLGLQFAPQVRGFVGFTFLYWTEVLRPGDQIDNRVNTTLVPTSLDYTGIVTAPMAPIRLNPADFWVMGLNFGLEFNF